MSLRNALKQVISGEILSSEAMEVAMMQIMGGEANPYQAAGLLTALATRGESVEEVTGAASAMIRAASPFGGSGSRDAIDTCGTGGDGSGTFNISTASAFVVAACGVPVCKHGNRAVSSKSGSADLLKCLGAEIDLPPAKMAEVFDETGFAFLFAPTYHKAMRHAMPIRRGLGVRTIFNLLGPLSNPARVRYQVIGVFDKKWLCLIEALRNLGAKRAVVIHGANGLDELNLCGETFVAELKEGGEIEHYTLSPEDVGLEPCTLEELRGGEAYENAKLLRKLFSGPPTSPIARAIQYNAGMALYLKGKAPSLQEGVALAGEAFSSGGALEVVDKFVRATQERA